MAARESGGRVMTIGIVMACLLSALAAWMIRSYLANRRFRKMLLRIQHRPVSATVVGFMDTWRSEIMNSPSWPQCGRLVGVVNGEAILCNQAHMHLDHCDHDPAVAAKAA